MVSDTIWEHLGFVWKKTSLAQAVWKPYTKRVIRQNYCLALPQLPSHLHHLLNAVSHSRVWHKQMQGDRGCGAMQSMFKVIREQILGPRPQDLMTITGDARHRTFPCWGQWWKSMPFSESWSFKVIQIAEILQSDSWFCGKTHNCKDRNCLLLLWNRGINRISFFGSSISTRTNMQFPWLSPSVSSQSKGANGFNLVSFDR